MRKREYIKYAADFETAVFDGQDSTWVWSAGMCRLYTDDYEDYTNIDDFMHSLFVRKQNMEIYFHNLKFDGSFILQWLKRQPDFSEGLMNMTDGTRKMKKPDKLLHKQYTYLVSDKGVFYAIQIMYHYKMITIWDSMKLIPFSLASAGATFRVKHQKLEMEYEGVRKPGYQKTEKEYAYQKNDVLCLKEVLEVFFDRGYTKKTIGSNCLAQYKEIVGKQEYQSRFPNQYGIKLPNGESAGEFVNQSYRGAWCYADPRYQDREVVAGVVVDANSLYPSVMHSNSGHLYPYGKPHYFTDEIPRVAKDNRHVYFVRIKIQFDIKPGYLPFIQIKGDLRYRSNVMQRTSKCYDKHGNFVSDPILTMTVTHADFALIQEHYNCRTLEIIDGVYYHAATGMFDEYIDKYMEIKMNTKDKVERTLAKLFLNNLYGKFAMYIDSSFKVFHLEEGVLKAETINEREKTPGYIPVGSLITSYARETTIRLAQKNYDHFCYADTDSLHCNCREEDLVDVPIHESKLCYWKVEGKFKKAWYHRQKTYLEMFENENKEEYYQITACGMGKGAKANLNKMLTSGQPMSIFTKGLTVPGNLKPRQIDGGVLLVKQDFVMRA